VREELDEPIRNLTGQEVTSAYWSSCSFSRTVPSVSLSLFSLL